VPSNVNAQVMACWSEKTDRWALTIHPVPPGVEGHEVGCPQSAGPCCRDGGQQQQQPGHGMAWLRPRMLAMHLSQPAQAASSEPVAGMRVLCCL
jgi:hypothetical protein